MKKNQRFQDKGQNKTVAADERTRKTPVNKPAQGISDLILSYGIWVVLGLVGLLILIIYHQFIFGDLYFLFKDIGSDSLNLTYPSLVHMSEYIRHQGFPLWSFSQGMGHSVANGLNDPFTWIVLFAGAKNVAASMIWMEVVKILLTAFLFYRFLRMLKLTAFSLYIGVILYSFSGFMIIGSNWTLFSTEACYLALLLLSFEMYFQKGKWYLFPVAIFLITILQPFNLYLYGLFLVAYFLMRHFSEPGRTSRELLKVTGGLILYGLIGVALSSFFLLLYIQIILESPRIGGSSSYFEQLISRGVFFTETSKYYLSALFRLFHNDFLGNGVKYAGWYNYLEAPLVYIGILPLLLLPQVFVHADKRGKLVSSLFLGILLLPLFFPYLRYALWLFTGDYFRGYSIFISLPVLLYSLFALQKLEDGGKLNLYLLLATAIALLLLIYLPFPGTSQMVRDDVRGSVRNMIVIYSVIIGLFALGKYNRPLGLALLVMVFLESAFFNLGSVRERDVLSKEESMQKKGYNDYAVEAVKFIQSGDRQFFRINKGFPSTPAMHASYNDAKAQGFFGTRSYSSFNQKYYIRFLEEMGIIQKGNETMSRWSIGLTPRPLLQHLASTKYQVLKGQIPPPIAILYDSITTFGDVTVMKNRNFLPLGFTYDSYLPLSKFMKISTLTRELVMQRTCVVDDSLVQAFKGFPEFPLLDTLPVYTFTDLVKDVQMRKADTLNISSFNESRIKGTISPKSRKILFFSIPYDKGWRLVVDGRESKPLLVNIGFQGVVLEPGNHTIELYFRPPFFGVGLIISMAGLLVYAGLLYIAVKKPFNREKPAKEPGKSEVL